jgi:hypothetical protein
MYKRAGWLHPAFLLSTARRQKFWPILEKNQWNNLILILLPPNNNLK